MRQWCACVPPTVKVQPQWDDEGHFPGAGNACAERTTLTARVETLTGWFSWGTPLCSPLVMEAATLHTNHLAANSSHGGTRPNRINLQLIKSFL